MATAKQNKTSNLFFCGKSIVAKGTKQPTKHSFPALPVNLLLLQILF